MDIFTALHSHITASSNVTSLSSNRVYPMVAPINAKKPYVTLHQISNVPTHAMVNDANIHMYRMQISSWTSAFTQIVSLSTAIKDKLRDVSGTIGSSNFVVQRIFFDTEYDFPEINPETNKIVYQRAQDYLIWTTG
ncbi:MAG: DUF3168 domain-containing protein [Nitrosarchaeum sp.]